MSSSPSKSVTAALLIIGDEILSGRTEDANLSYLATWLGNLGIKLAEVRVVPDVQPVIVEAVNALRPSYDYVFTTGGIGPTHDDITADAIAVAFGVGIECNKDALAVLEDHYEDGALNDARRRMARVPLGGILIDNPVSKAPGFQIGNVFVLAGIPRVNRAMLESLKDRLVGGPPMLSRSVGAELAEGAIAHRLGEIQNAFPSVSIGSYPYYRAEAYGVTLVLRSVDTDQIEAAFSQVLAMITDSGAQPNLDPSNLV